MGFLRFYLALCVVIGHAGARFPFIPHDGTQAVQIFFMISGFYMALIMNEKYVSRRQFYASRFLRIYVPYFIALAIVLLVSIGSRVFLGHWIGLDAYAHAFEHNGKTGVILGALSSLTIFFQDVIMFLSQPVGASLRFTLDFSNDQFPLWHYLLIPQAWSVALELSFYLMVPWLAKLSAPKLFGLLLCSVVARVIGYEFLGLNTSPWIYRFFPFELALFLAGMLAYRFYSWGLAPLLMKERDYRIRTPILWVITIMMLVVHAVFFASLKTVLGFHYSYWVSYVIWPFIIALLFLLSKADVVDRHVGELSYPIYLIHFVMNGLVWVSIWKCGISIAALPKWIYPTTCALVSVVSSALVYVFVLIPFEKWRGAFSKRIA